jgi:hypothetical protein
MGSCTRILSGGLRGKKGREGGRAYLPVGRDEGGMVLLQELRADSTHGVCGNGARRRGGRERGREGARP